MILSANPVRPLCKRAAADLVIQRHYLHRRPPISYAFGLYDHLGDLVGVCTFGTPPSRHLQISACPSDPAKVIELNRLWVDDLCERNTESFFIARCLKLLPPFIVVSYADTKEQHFGYVYRAANFKYAGWTDMERKTPRYDYHVEGKHSRDAFRGEKVEYTRVQRKPKVRYWTVTGNKRDRRDLARLCEWDDRKWAHDVPPGEGNQL